MVKERVCIHCLGCVSLVLLQHSTPQQCRNVWMIQSLKVPFAWLYAVVWKFCWSTAPVESNGANLENQIVILAYTFQPLVEINRHSKMPSDDKEMPKASQCHQGNNIFMPSESLTFYQLCIYYIVKSYSILYHLLFHMQIILNMLFWSLLYYFDR